MAARKKSARKKAAPSRSSAALMRMQASLPPSLRPYAAKLRRLANRFERQLESAGTRYRVEAARCLRGAGSELERLERRGEGTWHRLDSRARARILGLLAQLERTVRTVKVDTRGGERRARSAVRGAKRAMTRAAARMAP